MRWLLNGAYLLAAVLALPFWLPRMIRTGKIRTNWPARLGRGSHLPRMSPNRLRLLIHAVSVGELNAIRLLVDQLTAHTAAPDLVIATTTDTGFDHAQRLFKDRLPVVRYPLDVSFAVDRFLDRIRPDAVALVELEVWPNFLATCRHRSIPVAVINGRLTKRSAKRYDHVRPLIRKAFASLDLVATQSDEYAERFAALGVPRDRIHVVGTMKWDTAVIADEVPGSDELAEAMGIDRTRPLVVVGSTAPGEHALLHDVVPGDAQLLCAPRKPEWFDDAARAMPSAARRSRDDRGSASGRFLLDTIGELRQAYALADLVVIGRTFVPLGGSDMIEPIALGKPTIVGPHVEHFQETTVCLLAGDGLLQIDRDSLATTIRTLLNDPGRRQSLATAGREVIRRHQGATQRHVDLLVPLLEQRNLEQVNS